MIGGYVPSEKARVIIDRTDSHLEVSWLQPVINGYTSDTVIHIQQIDDTVTMERELVKLIKEVYKRAYTDGRTATQFKMREALGIQDQS